MRNIKKILAFVLDYFYPIGPTFQVDVEKKGILHVVTVSSSGQLGVRRATQEIYHVIDQHETDGPAGGVSLGPVATLLSQQFMLGNYLFDQLTVEEISEKLIASKIEGPNLVDFIPGPVYLGAAKILMARADQVDLDTSEMRTLNLKIDRHVNSLSIFQRYSPQEQEDVEMITFEDPRDLAHAVIAKIASGYTMGPIVAAIIQQHIDGWKDGLALRQLNKHKVGGFDAIIGNPELATA